MPKIVPIDSRVHQNTKINADQYLSFTRKNHIAPIVIHEIVAATHEFPLMFLKDKEANKLRLCAVLGLKPEQNLFFSEKGWKGEYVPAAIRAYPFAIMAHPQDKDQRILCVDEDSDWVTEEEGTPLFQEDGERTEFVEKLGQFLLDLNQKQQITEDFIAALEENEILVERALEVGIPNAEKYQINGVYVIDEQKFNELSDEKFLEFRKKGYIGAVYGILMSMSRVNRLLKLVAESEVEAAAEK